MRWLGLLALAACTPAQDPQAFLDYQASFLRPGVNVENEETEVRRVLAQRGLRVKERVQQAGFIALGAANRRTSAVRVITGRGVVVAEDAEADDLFQPSTLALLDGFALGEYSLVAYTRTSVNEAVGCATLQRILPDASAVPCVLDSSDFGARACVSMLAPGRNGQLRAKVAWPSLHTVAQLDVELAFAPERDERTSVVRLAPGPWIDQETSRYNAAQLSKADFATRHAVGIARAALARLTGKSVALQVDLYRNAVGTILPGSLEAEAVGDTLRHIQSGWLEAPAAPQRQPDPPVPEPSAPQPIDEPPPDSIVVEPAPDTR
ncbi:MAG TPA: hypothetical protein VFX59_00265 [Polyangiales bacterium]|nr:hypothetical protein [Polyangiales bacterium]